MVLISLLMRCNSEWTCQ